MATTTKTPITDLTLAEVISLTQAGLIGLKDGAPAYTDKADRAAKAGATKARRQAVLANVTEFFASPQGQKAKFFSVKPTSGMFAACATAINMHVEATREDILWSLKQLEKKGLAKQVGITSKIENDKKFMVVVPVAEVNNFQRRWVHSIEAAPAADAPAQDDSAE
tara:strand:+ start:72 stop:569 length:498 start_codon:yes stop_codon:yes gene_type:complete